MKKILGFFILLAVVALVVGCTPQVTETVETTTHDDNSGEVMEEKDGEAIEEKSTEETIDPEVEEIGLEAVDEEDDFGDVI